MSDIFDEFHALIGRLEEEGHVLAERFRSLFEKITGEAPVVEAEVKADTAIVVHDAETAAVPVVAEVEHDAVKDAGEVVSDAVAAVETSAAPASAVPTATP